MCTFLLCLLYIHVYTCIYMYIRVVFFKLLNEMSWFIVTSSLHSVCAGKGEGLSSGECHQCPLQICTRGEWLAVSDDNLLIQNQFTHQTCHNLYILLYRRNALDNQYCMRALPLLMLFAGYDGPGCGSPLAGSETDCSREWNRDPRTLHRHSLFQKHVLQAGR